MKIVLISIFILSQCLFLWHLFITTNGHLFDYNRSWEDFWGSFLIYSANAAILFGLSFME